MAFDTLPPWQQLPYFWPAATHFFTLDGTVQRVAVADPQRVMVAFCSTSSSPLIGPTNQISVPYNGIQLKAYDPLMVFDHATFGPMVNGEWYATTPNVGDVLMVMEVSLAKWPQPRTAPQQPPQSPWYHRALNALRGQM